MTEKLLRAENSVDCDQLASQNPADLDPNCVFKMDIYMNKALQKCRKK